MKITLRAARVNAGLTLQDVARELDICPNTVANWELNPEQVKEWKLDRLIELYGIEKEDIKY